MWGKLFKWPDSLRTDSDSEWGLIWSVSRLEVLKDAFVNFFDLSRVLVKRVVSTGWLKYASNHTARYYV